MLANDLLVLKLFLQSHQFVFDGVGRTLILTTSYEVVNIYSIFS